jgi:uncharacterized repeat protein (TIGR01451 family)
MDLLEGLRGHAATPYASWDSLPYVALHVDVAALEGLAVSPYVTTIQEDRASPPHLASTTAHIGADLTFTSGFGGNGQTVVILDTGIDANHPFYSGRVVAQACWSAAGGGTSLCPDGTNNQIGPGAAEVTDGAGNPTPACDNGAGNQICDHGSHVAGIAAGEEDPLNPQGFNGVAPDARIIALQVFSRFTSVADCSPNPAPCVRTWDSDQLSALNYINNTLRHSFDIAAANMSLGGGMNTTACDGDAKKAAIDNLRSNGIATVISSGNDDWTDALSAPGCISTAITVGSVFDDPPDVVNNNMHDVVDLLAPGNSVNSSEPDDTYGSKSGTSMAAPHVTGAFAILKAIAPSMSVDDIESLLEQTGVLVTDTRAPNPAGSATGHVKPRIQLDAAVAALLPADLRVFKDCKPDRPLLAGETATCTIWVENLGPAPALDVSLVDDYISNGVFQFGFVDAEQGTCTSDPNPQLGAGSVSCSIGSLAAGAMVRVTIEVTADAEQDIDDLVTVFHENELPDPDFGNNVATDQIAVFSVADLSLSKDDSEDPLTSGTLLTYTLQVGNDGPSTATNVVVADNLPLGVSVLSVSSTGGTCNAGVPGNPLLPTTCTFDSIAPAGSDSMTIVVNVDPGVLNRAHNDARVFSDVFDPDNSNNLATEDTSIQVADLALLKSSDADVYKPSSTVEYIITVMNHGPADAENVVVTDVLPDLKQALYQTDTAGCARSGLELTCDLGAIPAATSRSFSVYVRIRGKQGLVSSSASVDSTTADPDPSDNTSTRTILVKGGL